MIYQQATLGNQQQDPPQSQPAPGPIPEDSGTAHTTWQIGDLNGRLAHQEGMLTELLPRLPAQSAPQPAPHQPVPAQTVPPQQQFAPTPPARFQPTNFFALYLLPTHPNKVSQSESVTHVPLRYEC